MGRQQSDSERVHKRDERLAVIFAVEEEQTGVRMFFLQKKNGAKTGSCSDFFK